MTPCTFKVTDVYKTPSNCFYRLFVLFMHFSRCLLQFEPFYILGIRFSTWRYKGIAVNPINKETASSRQLQVIGPYFQSPEMNTALITKQSFSCFSLYVRVFGGPAQSGIAELCISIVETCRHLPFGVYTPLGYIHLAISAVLSGRSWRNITAKPGVRSFSLYTWYTHTPSLQWRV